MGIWGAAAAPETGCDGIGGGTGIAGTGIGGTGIGGGTTAPAAAPAAVATAAPVVATAAGSLGGAAAWVPAGGGVAAHRPWQAAG